MALRGTCFHPGVTNVLSGRHQRRRSALSRLLAGSPLAAALGQATARDRELQLAADSDSSGRLRRSNGVIGPSGFFGWPDAAVWGSRTACRVPPRAAPCRCRRFTPRRAVFAVRHSVVRRVASAPSARSVAIVAGRRTGCCDAVGVR